MPQSRRKQVVFELERAEDRERWWVREDMYTAEPRTPLSAAVYNTIWDESSLWIAERLSFPTSRGFNVRTVGGYTYLGPLEVTDQSEIESRTEVFLARVRALVEGFDEQVRDTRAQQEAITARWRATELAGMGAIDLLAHWRAAVLDLAQAHRWHFLIAFPRHAVTDRLERFGRTTGAIPGPTDLGRICQSARVTQRDLFEERLWQLVEATQGTDLFNLLLEHTAEELPEKIKAAPGGASWWEQFRAAVDRYDKLTVPKEISSPALSERPEPVLEQVRTYAGLGEGHTAAMRASLRAADRDRALTAALASLEDESDRAELREQADDAERMQVATEDDNVYLLPAGVIVRRVALAIGEALASAGRFESVDDVFYLRSEEMEQAVKDLPARTPTPDLRPLVAARRHERELQRSAAPPPRIGEVPAQVDNFMLNKFWGMPVGTDDAPIPGGQLKGIGASDGLVEGPAHVALSLEDLEGLAPGAILVVPATNPAWMHAFVRIAGIVTDQGGSLSHAAVVAREYRIPAVLGTQRATLDIQHGRIIRIDGTNGTVEILK